MCQGNASVAQFRITVGKTLKQQQFNIIDPPFGFDLGIPGLACQNLTAVTPTLFKVRRGGGVDAGGMWCFLTC